MAGASQADLEGKAVHELFPCLLPSGCDNFNSLQDTVEWEKVMQKSLCTEKQI